MSQKAYKGELNLCVVESGNSTHDAKTCSEGQEIEKKEKTKKQTMKTKASVDSVAYYKENTTSYWL
jgi:hypothetical protein